MKLYKCFLFMLILICSLINISGNNSPIGIGESSNDSKRALEEQIDNYIILQFNQDVTYEGGEFLYYNSSFYNSTYDYNQYISYIKNGNETIDRNTNFTVKSNTKLEVHFNQTITTLERFLNGGQDSRFESLISADFCHFDISSLTSMRYMFYACYSLQTLNSSNFDTSSVTNIIGMFIKCSSLTLYLSTFNSSSVTDLNSMFYKCSSLQSLYLSNFNTSLVPNMRYTLYVFWMYFIEISYYF